MQRQVLSAAVDLVNGGQDMEEALSCYKTISNYVLNSTYNKSTTTGVTYGTYRCDLKPND